MMRDITGIGEGNGPFMVIHDGFGGTGGGHLGWTGYLAGADRLGLYVPRPPLTVLSCVADW